MTANSQCILKHFDSGDFSHFANTFFSTFWCDAMCLSLSAFIIIISSSAALQIVELECCDTRNCVFLSTFKTMAISCTLNSKWFKQFRSNNSHSVCFTYWWHSRHAIAFFLAPFHSLSLSFFQLFYIFSSFFLDIFLFFSF